jgi:hypothetical protein
MNKIKIDWVNHLVAFISTLLGIYIAFQLNEWQNSINEKEKINSALSSIKLEIQKDISIYDENVSKISDLLGYINFIRNHSNTKGEIIASEASINEMKKMNIDRFRDLTLIKKLNDSLNIYKSSFIVDFVPVTGISTNNWEAAKFSGILISMNHSHVSILTSIYDWVVKDLGFDDSDFYKRLINKEKPGFDNLNTMIIDYQRIMNIYKFKSEKIKESFKTISWEVR